MSPTKNLELLNAEIQRASNDLANDEQSTAFKQSELVGINSGSNASGSVKLSSKDEVKPWVHFVAGGIGGMTGAIFTCPLDVVKTRLQSSVYKDVYKSSKVSSNMIVQGAHHLKETCSIIHNVYSVEGAGALFKGLGPNLVGVIPARSINFFTYGLGKDVISKNFFHGEENSVVHLLAAVNAGIVTSTATNPIWLVKTRLQLDRATSKQYKNSWDCIKSVIKHEGIRGLYKGLTASYLGSAESTLQWVLYEQMKMMIHSRAVHNELKGHERTKWDLFVEWSARSGAAGAAKFIASMVTYPHEVIRTRLRQAPSLESGKPKYTGLVQCFKLIVKEEGFISMYGGLTPHLMRTVPNSIIMFGTWEVLTKLLS